MSKIWVFSLLVISVLSFSSCQILEKTVSTSEIKEVSTSEIKKEDELICFATDKEVSNYIKFSWNYTRILQNNHGYYRIEIVVWPLLGSEYYFLGFKLKTGYTNFMIPYDGRLSVSYNSLSFYNSTEELDVINKIVDNRFTEGKVYKKANN